MCCAADFHGLLALMSQLHPAESLCSDQLEPIFLEILSSNYFILLVAEENRRLVGSCYLILIPNLTREGRSYAVIENVVVDRSYRNLGVGKALMNRSFEVSERHNCYKVMLLCGRDESVHSFYQSCGFDDQEKRAYVKRL